jgi:hypothetical protein
LFEVFELCLECLILEVLGLFHVEILKLLYENLQRVERNLSGQLEFFGVWSSYNIFICSCIHFYVGVYDD